MVEEIQSRFDKYAVYTREELIHTVKRLDAENEVWRTSDRHDQSDYVREHARANRLGVELADVRRQLEAATNDGPRKLWFKNIGEILGFDPKAMTEPQVWVEVFWRVSLAHKIIAEYRRINRQDAGVVDRREQEREP